jgi:hypothetical protein
MKLSVITVLYILLFSWQIQAQENVIRCGTMKAQQMLWAKDPLAKARSEALNKELITLTRKYSSDKTSELVFRIPVVVHVVHDFGPENISDNQVKSQIDALNRDFNGASAQELGLRFEFFLAKIDPWGKCTNGITRTISPYTVHGLGDRSASSREQLTSLVSWASDRYLNIWVVRSIDQTILGYSDIGVSGNPKMDGVVVRYKSFGEVEAVAPPYNKGRTTVHEVGHWLSLHHPFQMGETCCLNPEIPCDSCGDYVCDTPNMDSTAQGCPSQWQNCKGNSALKTAPIHNFMGYTDDACMNEFTKGQLARVVALLTSQRTFIHTEANMQLTGYYGCPNGMEETSSLSVQIYPSPVSETLYYQLDNPNSRAYQLSITDISGKVLADLQTNQSYGSIDVSAFASGVYALKIQQGNQIFVRKWCKN